MAYDPNCAETKAAVKAAVNAALAAQAEEHEADVEGLKTKNRELIQDLKKARKGEAGEVDTAEVARLEGEVRELGKKLRAAEKLAVDAAEERDAATARADKEASVTKNLLTENGLTAALTKANVKSEFLPAVLALLSGKVEIKEVSGKREALVNGKPLGEFVEEWAKTDEGKHYVGAPLNGGGGSSTKLPTNPQGGEKKISEMTLQERTELHNADPKKFNEMLQAEGGSSSKGRRRSSV